jgi:hypothetical protein
MNKRPFSSEWVNKIMRATVGPQGKVGNNLSAEHFPKLVFRTIYPNLQLVPFKDGETGEEAARRLVDEGYALEDLSALSFFLRQRPKEIFNKCGVLVLADNSQWLDADGYLRIPLLYVYEGRRYLALQWFRREFRANCLILVSRKVNR